MPKAITRKDKQELATRYGKNAMARRAEIQKLKAGDLVIVRRRGVVGRETPPTPIREVTKTEILIGLERFSRTTGEQIEEVHFVRDDNGKRVKQEPEPYPARILRLATSEDLAAQAAKRREAEESTKTMEATNRRMEEIAAVFPEGMRPSVSVAWNNEPGALHLEFDGLTETTVHQIAELLKKVNAK
jgi:hypothetical protein